MTGSQHSRNYRAVAALLFLTAFAFPTATVLAQATTSENAQEWTESQDWFDTDTQLLQIDFPGGTIAELVDHVRQRVQESGEAQQALGKFNVIVTAEAEDVTLPSISVQTDYDELFSCVEACSTDNVAIEIERLNGIGVIRVREATERQVRVFNIKDLLVTTKQEDLVAAINIGLEMGNAANSLEFKLHEESGLLFVRAADPQLHLVEQIVDQLAVTNRGAGAGGGPFGAGGGAGGAPGPAVPQYGYYSPAPAVQYNPNSNAYEPVIPTPNPNYLNQVPVLNPLFSNGVQQPNSPQPLGQPNHGAAAGSSNLDGGGTGAAGGAGVPNENLNENLPGGSRAGGGGAPNNNPPNGGGANRQ